ncbi:PTS sugar transporter subunit IIA [Salinithrix halophila]|uniref:Mannitol-specific phosphotransferase enzyme IIA component n=1 Tax=Salinithrix halophila TaxID=1485204 RepID=A0ABV8JMK2_9BACL
MSGSILSEETVLLGVEAKNKEEAIRLAGGLLVDNQCVAPSYVGNMLERERTLSTYIGNHVAIPHGTEEGKKDIHRSGISIVQLPEGVDFGSGHTAHIVIGIAGKDSEHMDILSRIALVVSEQDNVARMVKATSAEELLSLFHEGA